MSAVSALVGLVPVAVAGGIAIGMTRAAMSTVEQPRARRAPASPRRSRARKARRNGSTYMGWL